MRKSDGTRSCGCDSSGALSVHDVVRTGARPRVLRSTTDTTLLQLRTRGNSIRTLPANGCEYAPHLFFSQRGSAGESSLALGADCGA